MYVNSNWKMELCVVIRQQVTTIYVSIKMKRDIRDILCVMIVSIGVTYSYHLPV